MEKELSPLESSETKKEKDSVWYRIIHWTILIYVFVAGIAVLYGGYSFINYIISSIKDWV